MLKLGYERKRRKRAKNRIKQTNEPDFYECAHLR